ncbi:DEAD/DEAH box helicase [Methylocystis echinoides]|uniref:DEAD-box ATP-dependent RNA helicase RhpA n=1 Tax=Methylocystis echinoides TaxID=29468 RepID=A0A9W6GUK6_9HYPH|nr:DEAD/DEAH box helicase [Methylocystis echinoides]GLI93213.1 DEAD/DEAH box helicase [Methylocystis echinoides]
MTKFSDLGLAEILLRALDREGYETPTSIQAQAIPYLMQGRDLLGIAQTGTGKTAAFALPILERLAAEPRRPAPFTARALVLAPTRELAAQIADSFRAYGQFMRPSVGVIVGGVSHRPQNDMLARGLDVLVATPGRLLDHIASGRMRLASTEVLVLDEADHMLDLGFIVPIRQIVAKLPKKRQTLLFSATMPKEIAGLAQDMLNNPAQVSVTPVATTAERVDQHVFFVDGGAKRDLLIELMNDADISRAIVFTRTKRGADRVAQHLDAAGVGAEAIHGNKSQSQRIRALDSFRKGRTRVLVATDIAARGIDVDGVSHVVNYELPETPEAYVHRIGRTARAGASGRAISLCENGERPLLRQIEKLTRQSLPVTDRRSADQRHDDAQPARRVPRGGAPKAHAHAGARNASKHPRREGHHSDGHHPAGPRPARPGNGQKRRAFGGGNRAPQG